MRSLELWDNLLQLAVTLAGGLFLLRQARLHRNRSLIFLSGAQMGWALGLTYWVLYLALRGRAPAEPNPAQFVWSGAHLFYIAVIRSLHPGDTRGPKKPLAFLAPLMTLPFTVLWFILGKQNSPLVDLVWGLGIAWIALESFHSLLFCLETGRRDRARYHGAVLAMLLFDEFVLFFEMMYQPADFQRLNWYYAFDLLVTLALSLQACFLKRAEAP